MVVFVTAAAGFLGRSIAGALADAGHALVLGVHRRSPPGLRGRVERVDFERDHDAAVWLPRLADVDVVVNTAGILREAPGATFDGLHSRGPRALFAACAEAGVGQVIQLSALGADDAAQSRYHLSKREADRFLATLAIPSVVVQPSLVYGPGGTSAHLFETLATLPLLALPAGGSQQVQPVHLDDLMSAIVALVGRDTAPGTTLAVVGPQPLSLAEYLQQLRTSMGRRRARVLAVPVGFAAMAASVASLVPGALLDRDTLAMLARGNTADPAPLRDLVQRELRPAASFVEPRYAQATHARAVLAWQLPLLRATIAFVWIWTGVVSLGLYPVEESYSLLARLGVQGTLATALLYGAAVIDLALGIGTLVVHDRRWIWRAQIAVMLGYTLLISAWLPEFWLHPYGPLSKNLPLLAATWLVATLESRRERH